MPVFSAAKSSAQGRESNFGAGSAAAAVAIAQQASAASRISIRDEVIGSMGVGLGQAGLDRKRLSPQCSPVLLENCCSRHRTAGAVRPAEEEGLRDLFDARPIGDIVGDAVD